MAVAHDASSAGGHLHSNSFSWTHTPSGTPAGALVFVINLTATGHTENSLDSVTVTYGGSLMDPSTDGYAHGDTAEGAYLRAYFLGSDVPTGAQTVQVNENSSAFNNAAAYAITVTADTDVEITGAVIQETAQALSEVNVDDGSPGTNSMRYAAVASGLSSPPAQGANSTVLHTDDFGSFSASSVRETTAGQGARPIGWSDSSDDVTAVYLAVRELVQTHGLAFGLTTL